MSSARTPEFQETLRRELVWVRETRAAVWRGLDAFLSMLAHDQPRVRVSVPYTLGLLIGHAGDDIPEDVPEPHARISQAMSAQLDWEAHPLVKASLVFGLARLAGRFRKTRA